jgi:hypothetical protein
MVVRYIRDPKLQASPSSIPEYLVMAVIEWYSTWCVEKVQGDSGGKVNFLGGKIVRHRERNVCMNMCLILNGYWDRDVWIYKYRSIVNGNKEKVLTVKCILITIWCINDKFVTIHSDGFGGLVVSMLASGSLVRGFRPGRSRWIFTSVKILSMPSVGGEVKVSVPCPSFAACKRT